MKKFLRIVICITMIMTLVACGGSDSADVQKVVVEDFFTALKAGDLKKVDDLCTDDNTDLGEITKMAKEFETLEDVNTYGEKFVNEAKGFVTTIFDKLIESYEVKSIGKEKDGDNYIAVVNIKMRDFSSVDFNSEKINKIQEDYQTKHLNELKKIYSEKGEQAMMEKIFGDLATQFFDVMKKEIENVEAKDIVAKVTLTQVGDSWKISKVE